MIYCIQLFERGDWILGWESKYSPWSPPSKSEDEQTTSTGMRIFYNQVKLTSWKLQQLGSKDIPVQHPQILQVSAYVIDYLLELCSKAPMLKTPIIGLENMEKSTGFVLEGSFLLVSFHGAGKHCAHHKRIKVIINLTQAWSLQATIRTGQEKHVQWWQGYHGSNWSLSDWIYVPLQKMKHIPGTIIGLTIYE